MITAQRSKSIDLGSYFKVQILKVTRPSIEDKKNQALRKGSVVFRTIDQRLKDLGLTIKI
jgi:hypothetical protein